MCTAVPLCSAGTLAERPQVDRYRATHTLAKPSHLDKFKECGCYCRSLYRSAGCRCNERATATPGAMVFPLRLTCGGRLARVTHDKDHFWDPAWVLGRDQQCCVQFLRSFFHHLRHARASALSFCFSSFSALAASRGPYENSSHCLPVDDGRSPLAIPTSCLFGPACSLGPLLGFVCVCSIVLP